MEINMKRLAAALAALLMVALAAAACAQVVELPLDLSGGLPYAPEGRLSETSYEDESISVTVEKMRWEETTCYVARVRIAHPSQLRTAPAYAFNRNQTAPISDIAKRVNAVLAINGDYCTYQMKSGSYLLRQGTLYMNDPNPRRDILIIDRNGDFIIEPHAEKSTMDKYNPDELANCFNFGPALVMNGEKLSEEDKTTIQTEIDAFKKVAAAYMK